MASGTVEHLGIIREINSSLIRVSIIPETACGKCHARGFCSVSDNSEKMIDVVRLRNETFSVGEEIKVVLEQSLGIKALSLGYLFPFLVLLSTLIVLISAGMNEGVAGLLAIASLAPYYTGIFFFRDRLKKEFSFRLKKCNNLSENE